jgi:hypothetical protein
MSEQTGALPAAVRSLNLLEASVDDLSAVLIARLVTAAHGCGTFSCGTFRGRPLEAETAANTERR